MPTKQFIILYLMLVDIATCDLAFTELSKVGIIPGKNYKLKIKGSPTFQHMVLKLVPNISGDNSCTTEVINEYKTMLNRIITPINQSLALMKSYISSRTNSPKFWGAVIGGVALGVATSAQITAGIALHSSIQNAQAIKNMKEAILNTNKAVESITSASGKLVLAISALQDEINTKIIPLMTTMKCDIAKNTLRLYLSQYFSEIALIFGPNLRDPASETISVQVLSQAFNGDFESLLKRFNYNSYDVLDLLQSQTIRGRIIDVDMINYFIVIQIEYPEMIEIKDAIVQEFMRITFNQGGEEWMTVFPSNLLVRNLLVSNIDLTSCSRTDNSYICLYDTSSPISKELYDCSQGDLSKCAKVRIVNAYAPRFALSKGVVFANCGPITCICSNSNQHIIQDSRTTSTMISSEYCSEVQIDGMIITVGPKVMNRTIYSRDIKTGEQVVIDNIDIGNQLSSVTQDLDESKLFIQKSNDILKRLNNNVINANTIIYLIVISVIAFLWLIIITIIVIYLIRVRYIDQGNYHYQSGASSINSLSQLIPVA
ncbi:fusion protein [Jingmen Myotis davidii paramyxovirus 1]|uniref:Fusion glycoprotein F0 n=1 Tax=Jingmen Myotis davidii paramyxovirus 1 TaxID=2928983 RepID=A0A8T9KP82_9MONO|nr:fusion protein [Jingmen Myotis davidii paramyxovirus 1]